MHLGRFMHFSQKVVGVTLKTTVLSLNYLINLTLVVSLRDVSHLNEA